MSTDSKQLQQAKPDPAIGWVEANSPHLFLAFRQGSPMTQATSTITINAPPDVLWQVIRDFGAAGQYLVRVVYSTVEGAGVGAVRMLVSADGSTVVERLQTLDAAARRLSYVLLTDTPFDNCLTTMSVRDLGQGQSELTWSAIFQPAGIPAIEAIDLLEGALAGNCLALKRFVESGQQ